MLVVQMAVTGYLGKGLANSHPGGDDSTGALSSPSLTLEQRYLERVDRRRQVSRRDLPQPISR
jgi:hypothetical protein